MEIDNVIEQEMATMEIDQVEEEGPNLDRMIKDEVQKEISESSRNIPVLEPRLSLNRWRNISLDETRLSIQG